MSDEENGNVSETAPAPSAPTESVPQPAVETVTEMPAQKDVMPPEPAAEPVQGEVPEPLSAQAESAKAQMPANEPLPPPAPPVTLSRTEAFSAGSMARTFAAKAHALIFDRKRKKLDRIVAEAGKRGSVTNDQVEKLLRVSDATATRYLSQLVKEGKVRQEGKNGSGVKYVKL